MTAGEQAVLDVGADLVVAEIACPSRNQARQSAEPEPGRDFIGSTVSQTPTHLMTGLSVGIV